MPLISRFFIRTGIFFFVGSFLLQLINEFSWSFSGITPVFWHLLIVGWITQIIFGVAHWMFPGRVRTDDFSENYMLWISFIALNSGLILRAFAEPINYFNEDFLWDILLTISAILQFVSISIFVIEMWPRTRSKKRKATKKG